MGSRPEKQKGVARLNRLINLNAFPINSVLRILLKDRTTGENIIWATDSYSHLGNTYHSSATIRLKDLTKLDQSVIQPRVYKALEEQKQRTKVSAEVFTPSWICCLMNNHLDDVWFGRKDVFNKMDGQKWRATNRKIDFPISGSKTWQGYVDSRRIEITCGEAPYLVSRYDTTTGKVLDLTHRIGILDRKLRVINENAETEEEWIKWALRAYQSTYGYEYQGDNLLIARINLLMTFCDYLQDKWDRDPTEDELKAVAHIISWNIWQMNGLTYNTSYDADADRARLQAIIDDCDKIIAKYEEKIEEYNEYICNQAELIELMQQEQEENKRLALSIDDVIELVKKESLLSLAYMYAEYNDIFIIDEDDRDYAAELEDLSEDIDKKYKEAQLLRSETYAKKCKIVDAPHCLIKNWRMRRTECFRDIAQKSKGKGIMKFDFCIGNPPYQAEKGNKKFYPYFYTESLNIANCVEMIFPTAWQEPKTANGLQLMNKPEIKEDQRIVFIDNRHNAFPGVTGAEWTNIVLWNSKYDNGLNGQQKILTEGKCAEIKKLLQNNSEIQKPQLIVDMFNLINTPSFQSLLSATSVVKPYGLRTDVADKWSDYKLAPMYKEKQCDTDIVLICGTRECYLPFDYKLPRETHAKNKFKVFVPNAWGNLSETYIGGAYADVIIAAPGVICSETYLESGCFDTKEMAAKHAKYLMTRFCRALLFLNKYSLLCAKAWGAIPLQDYSESWWDKSIYEIEEHLFDKYSIPDHIRDFVRNNIQQKSEVNIVNF